MRSKGNQRAVNLVRQHQGAAMKGSWLALYLMTLCFQRLVQVKAMSSICPRGGGRKQREAVGASTGDVVFLQKCKTKKNSQGMDPSTFKDNK